MSPEADPIPRNAPVLRTLVVCDLADSTELTERLGDDRAIDLFRKHDRAGRDLLARHRGREIDKTDGFLLLFERPIQAVEFALDYQHALKGLSRTHDVGLRARIGIHAGEVSLWENSPEDVAQGAKPLEVQGLVKPIAARLMTLARPGQILLSGLVHALLQRSLSELGPRAEQLRFKSYGLYRLKGVHDPLPVFEVGEAEIAPLKRPAASDKAQRDLPWWRRPRVLALEIGALALAIGIPAWFATHSEPTFAFAPRDWAVVADLQNRTGQGVFDDSLQTAFRIGLEQSRYVNVLSDLQVRDTLKRMQRDDKAALDSTAAAEVAQREGARVVIVPTLAEVGGKLRFHAEVVDPVTLRTVYAESAEGAGAESALASVDQVVRALRGRLGEAAGAIQSQPQPLAKVTTSSLDALRAYTLAQRAQARGKWSDAIPLYERALQFDPAFALAHMGLARIWWSSAEYAKARAELALALEQSARLPPRDAVYLDAWRTTFGKPADRLEKWKLLATLYPDYFAGYHNYALFSWEEFNDFQGGLSMIDGALSPHNPFRASVHYQRAVLLLGLERYEDALRDVREARTLGLSGIDEVGAMTRLAQRQPEAARGALAGAPGTLGSLEFRRVLSEATIDADQGKLDAAAARLDREAQAPPGTTLSGQLGSAAALGVHQFTEDAARFEQRLRRTLEAALSRTRDAGEPQRDGAAFQALLTAYLAAHNGHEELARDAITALSGVEFVRDYPANAALAALVEAELLRRGGSHEAALAALRRLVGHGEPYLVHVAIRDALANSGQNDAALSESEWLASHRGRALAEGTGDGVCRPVNAIESDLALLAAAELAHALGQDQRASKHLAAFRRAWPERDDLPKLATRLAALEQLETRAAQAR